MRLIDADELLRKWDQLTSRGRIEFDQVIMSEPTQDVFTKNDKKKWIPCKERLPEESGTYIVTAESGDIKHVTFVKWMPRLHQWNLIGSRAYWKVIAWMPLPEPYGEEA